MRRVPSGGQAYDDGGEDTMLQELPSGSYGSPRTSAAAVLRSTSGCRRPSSAMTTFSPSPPMPDLINACPTCSPPPCTSCF